MWNIRSAMVEPVPDRALESVPQKNLKDCINESGMYTSKTFLQKTALLGRARILLRIIFQKFEKWRRTYDTYKILAICYGLLYGSNPGIRSASAKCCKIEIIIVTCFFTSEFVLLLLILTSPSSLCLHSIPWWIKEKFTYFKLLTPCSMSCGNFLKNWITEK